WEVFPLGDVRDRREVNVLLRIVAELHSMAELAWLRQTVHVCSNLSDSDDRRQVVRIAVDGNATAQCDEQNPLGLQVAIVARNEGGELRAGRVPAHENSLWITAVLDDVPRDPAE